MNKREMQNSSEIKMVEVPSFPELEFEPETHTYTLRGLVIPSVSNIMEPLIAEKYAGISEKTLNKAADKGSMVHNAIENWIKFGFEDITTENKGYFEAFLKWWERYKPMVVGSEIRLYHRLMGYGGTVDLLCYIDETLYLIDFKCTQVLSDMTCGVQLEGYAQAMLSHGISIGEKAILHLRKDGTYEFRKYPAKDANRWRVFSSLKCIYDYIKSCV